MTTPYIRQKNNEDLLDRRRHQLTNRQLWALDWQRQGMRIKAIAEGFDCSVSAAQKTLQRARKRLGLTRRQGYRPEIAARSGSRHTLSPSDSRGARATAPTSPPEAAPPVPPFR